MNVVMILTNSFNPDHRVYKEASYLTGRGHAVEILCWDRQRECADRADETVGGIRVRRFFPLSRPGSGLRQAGAYLRFALLVRAFLKGKDFDVLHCHDLDGALAGALAGRRRAGRTVVFDMHEYYEGQPGRRGIRGLIRFLTDRMQSRADHILYVNDIQKSHVRPANLSKFIFLPNYPDSALFREIPKTVSPDLRIAYIGKVRQYDELKLLLDVCRDIPGVTVSIHGDGCHYGRLREIAGDYPGARITGRYAAEDSPRLYSGADLVYAVYDNRVANWAAAYPVKFFESVITRTPVIVGRGTAVAEFVESRGIGYAVDPEDPAEVGGLIRRLCAHREELDERRARLSEIQYDFTWEKVVPNLDKAYGSGA